MSCRLQGLREPANGLSEELADFHTEATVSENGSLIIKGIPYLSGHKVEVIIKDKSPQKDMKGKYSLRGSVLKYEDPFEGVAENDWEILK